MLINKFVERLINIEAPHPIHPKPRWICKNNNKRISFVDSTRVPPSCTKKIESVLFRISEEFKRISIADANEGTCGNIDTLINSVSLSVAIYKAKHGRIYLLLSRIFFGDINKISETLIEQLETLKQRLNRPFPPEAKKIEPIIFPKPLWDDPIVINNPKPEPKPEPEPDPEPEPEPAPEPPFLPPTFPSAKPKPLISTTPSNPKTMPNIDIVPPVKKPPQEAIPEATLQLENLMKSSRLKFYELFAAKIQVPEQPKPPKEGEAPIVLPPIRLPFINISHKGVAIRLTQQHGNEGFEAWLEALCNNAGALFEEKPIKLKDQGPERYVIEITMSLEEAQKLIKDVPERGLDHLSKFTGQKDFEHLSCTKIHHNENEPDVENTIGYNVAKLVPHLRELLENAAPNTQPHIAHALPFVEFDKQGMTIRIPENEENLKSILQQVFALKSEVIEEEHLKHRYGFKFHIAREEVENVLKLLGMDKIPPAGLPERFSKGDISYIQYLTETQRYHAYQPVKTNDALESIRESLKRFVPNLNNATPLVINHPRGWLSIKIPKDNDIYIQNLSAYINCEPQAIQKQFNQENYAHEFIIHSAMLPNFLKKLKLDNTPEGYSYLETLQDLAHQQKLERIDAAETKNDLDLQHTISRTLSALNPKLKAFLQGFSPQDYPEADDIALVEAVYNNGSIDIKIPKALNDDLIPSGPATVLSFGQYLSQTFAIDGEIIKEPNQEEFYYLNIPNERVKEFLEKELAFLTLPAEYQKKESSIYIKIHNILKDSMVEIAPNSGKFKDHLQRIFGNDVKIKEDFVNYNYSSFSIPCENSADFAQKELALAKLIEDFQVSQLRHGDFNKRNEILIFKKVSLNIVTFFNKFQKDQNLNHPRGNVANLRKRNEPLAMPNKIPKFTKAQFITNVKIILEIEKIKKELLEKERVIPSIANIHEKFKKNEEILRLKGYIRKLESYVNNIEDTLNKVCLLDPYEDIKNINREPYDRQSNRVQAVNMEAYLMLIMNEFIENKNLTHARKRDTLVEIAVTCTPGTCMGGRHGKIYDAYQKLFHPEFADKVETELLNKVELFKNDLLTMVFKYEGQSVHKTAGFKKLCAEEFGFSTVGLDVTDAWMNYNYDENKQEFEMACRSNLANGVYNLILNDKEKVPNDKKEAEEEVIANLKEYNARLRKILSNEGLMPDEIEEEMERLFPQEVVDKKFVTTITLEAVQRLLMDIGILYN